MMVLDGRGDGHDWYWCYASRPGIEAGHGDHTYDEPDPEKWCLRRTYTTTYSDVIYEA